MAFIDSHGRLLGRWNIIDVLILSVLFFAALGILAVQSGWHQTSSQVVKGERDIEYTVLLRNLKTLKPNLFEAGKTLSITIRNQPRGEVTIVSSQVNPKKYVLPQPTGGFTLIDDPADRFGYDYLIRLRDHATLTQEGYVTEGIKVKIGLPIEVEGFDYRVSGVISSIDAAAEATPSNPSPSPKAH